MKDHFLPRCVLVLGIEISDFPSYENAIDLIRRRIAAGMPTFCVAVNPEKAFRAKHDPRLKHILETAQVRLCDGAGLSLASLLLNRKRLSRVTGVDLFLHLVGMSEREGLRVFVLGASPEANEAGCRALQKLYPALKLAGRHDGFFEQDQTVVQQINDSQADVLFVAIGSPKQEYWIARNMVQLHPRLLMGIGGSLDVVSGAVRRAPLPFRKLGMEWFYRLLCQPSRFRRQLALPRFAFLVFREMIPFRHHPRRAH